MTEQAKDDDVVPVVPADLSAADILSEGETVRMAQARIAREIVELYPDLADDTELFASLRGDVEWIVTAVPTKYAKAAPLIAQAYALRDHEGGSRRSQSTHE